MKTTELETTDGEMRVRAWLVCTFRWLRLGQWGIAILRIEPKP